MPSCCPQQPDRPQPVPPRRPRPRRLVGTPFRMTLKPGISGRVVLRGRRRSSTGTRGARSPRLSAMSLTTGGIPLPYRTPVNRPRRLWPRLWEPPVSMNTAASLASTRSRSCTRTQPKLAPFGDPFRESSSTGRRGRGAHPTPSAAGRGAFFQARCSVGLLVVVALLGGLSPLEQPVDLVGFGVPPLPQPELETRQQHHRYRIGRRRGDHPHDDLGVNRDERRLGRNGCGNDLYWVCIRARHTTKASKPCQSSNCSHQISICSECDGNRMDAQ